MSSYTLQNSINWAQTFIQYGPLTAGVASEPAISIGTMVRNCMLNAPLCWSWNRKEDSTTMTVVGTQDYTVNLTDFGFLEKASLIDGSGAIFEIKDIYNTNALSKSSTQQRPNALAVISNTPGTSIKIRFMGVPDVIYTVVLVYQVAAVPFGSFSITSVATAVAGNTAYTGVFTPASFAVGSVAQIAGFATSANNGSFTVVTCTGTVLTVANPAGVIETHAATAIDISWSPIPDQYSDVYNNLFLAEAFQSADDARAAQYRQRGIAALLAKAEGLTEMQRNVFMAQWISRDSSVIANQSQQRASQAVQARGV